jgi:ATP-dependent Clp protease protease subunit
MIANRTDDSAELLVFGDIGSAFDGGVSAAMFQETLNSLKDAKSITIKVNSPGGIASDGVAMFNALRDHPAHTVVEIVGVAASAAHLLAMGANEIVMKRGSMAMMHLPWGMTVGNAADMRKTASVLDKLTDQIVSVYKSRSRKHDATILRMLEEETWFGPDEAVAAGFADRVDNEPAVKNKIQPGRYLNCPKDWLDEPEKAEPPKLLNPWRRMAARRVESIS